MNSLFVKLLVVLFLVHIASSVHTFNHFPTLVGGYSQSSPAKLPSNIDAFVRKTKPELKNAKVVRVSSQVVAGTNWKIIYQVKNSRYEVVVFDQPWTNTLQVSSFKKSLSL